jgi:hypothetical protein
MEQVFLCVVVMDFELSGSGAMGHCCVAHFGCKTHLNNYVNEEH